MKIQVLRGQSAGVEIPLNASTFTNKIMGEHSLAFSFKSSVDLDIRVNDTIIYKGELYTLNQTVNFKKVSRFLFEYDFVFEGPRHTLSQYFLEHLGNRKFSYSGTAEEWLHLIVNCANAKSEGWSIGEFEDMGRVTVDFESTYILDALTMVAQAMKGEWGIKGKVISLKKTIGTPRSLSFSYGKSNGLYSLSRKSINEKKIVTRAYARGGEKNLPTGMKDYFKIPGYVEKNVNLYRVREGEFVDEDIYPKRTGSVTGVSTINKQLFSIIDTSIDFDLNNQKIDGESAYIVFKSGYLEGNQFEISSYNHSDKKVVFKANDEGNGEFFPTESVHAEIGDKYILTGIRMPQSYIDAAVAELTTKRQEYLDSNSSPRVVYELDIDILDLKRKNITLDIGDTVQLIDTQKGIDEKVRITELSHPGHYPAVLENGMTYNAVIGNDITYTLFEKIQNDIKENKQIITQTTKRSIEEDRILAARMRQLQNLIFDPDGYFDGSKIKPNSIETLMLSVGAKSQNFLLNGVRIEVNKDDNPNHLAISDGQLAHLEVSIEGLGYIWTISQLIKNDLVPGKSYYVSAKCSRSGLTGTWYVSDTPIGTESEAGYYHFNVGVIYSELEGRRDFSFTSGMTYINGGQIKTGTIDAERLNVNDIIVKGGLATGSDLSNAFNGLGNLAFEDMVELAKLGTTIIEGGYIKAELIDVVQLFAQQVTATNLKVTGNSSIGQFIIQDGALIGDGEDLAGLRSIKDTNDEVWSIGRPYSAASGYVDFMSVLFSSSSRARSSGLRIDITGGISENNALDIVNGDIKVKGKKGVTGKITLANTASSTTYYHFNFINGLLVEFTSSSSSANPF